MIQNTDQKVAYLSMEIGISSKIPTYSGGLGVLAGDFLKAMADISYPIVGVTLLNKHGYFFQEIYEGKQTEEEAEWSIDDFLEPVDTKVSVTIAGREVSVGCWLLNVNGLNGATVPVLFLHTDLPENTEDERCITDNLYGEGDAYRLTQEIVLGIGGFRMLRALGFNSIEKYHMNEGHAALLALELDKELDNREEIKKHCVFTTHTPVPEGHDKFRRDTVVQNLDIDTFSHIPISCFQGPYLNMTEVALIFSGFINGVAERHAVVSREMFPEYDIKAITNGVFARSWVSESFKELYDVRLPNWRQDPTRLSTLTLADENQLWEAHYDSKKKIIGFANATTNAGFDHDYFTIGWARRFTSYKRPDFLLENISRLEEIADKLGPIQIIYGGKAHPRDIEGKKLIEKIHHISKTMEGNVKLVYLKNYDMYLSRLMTGGVDVWLNTPLPPKEASGTSGMKCSLNGVPQLSVLDGWWHEGCVEGVTGWSFETPEELYSLLENEVISIFYNDRKKWLEIMHNTITINGSHFNAHRMALEYIEQAYDK